MQLPKNESGNHLTDRKSFDVQQIEKENQHENSILNF